VTAIVSAVTRSYDWTKRYPWIAECALKNRIKQFVIDGEAVVLGVDGDDLKRSAVFARLMIRAVGADDQGHDQDLE